MFEKTEDYKQARKASKDQITKVIKVWSAREETLHDEGFQEGAEFGYNKANEWHYVKDGDLPKEDCLVYYKDAMGIFSCSFVHPSHYIAGVESFFKANPQIIAWKEIVLPELKESE